MVIQVPFCWQMKCKNWCFNALWISGYWQEHHGCVLLLLLWAVTRDGWSRIASGKWRDILGLEGWQALDNEGGNEGGVRKNSGQRAWRSEGRGRAAAHCAHWARARMLGTRKAYQHAGNQGYSGKYKHLAQPVPAGDACWVRDKLLLRAGISERHSAFQSLIHFTLEEWLESSHLQWRNFGQRAKSLTSKTRAGQKWCCQGQPWESLALPVPSPTSLGVWCHLGLLSWTNAEKGLFFNHKAHTLSISSGRIEHIEMWRCALKLVFLKCGLKLYLSPKLSLHILSYPILTESSKEQLTLPRLLKERKEALCLHTILPKPLGLPPWQGQGKGWGAWERPRASGVADWAHTPGRCAGVEGWGLLVTCDRWCNLVSSSFAFFGYLAFQKKMHLLLLISNRTSHGNTWVAYESH